MDIHIQGLTKIYKGNIQALRGVDLQIQPGVFGLLGPNGAGKTTLMRILAGILSPSGGTLRIGGHDVRTDSGRVTVQRILGYLPQELGMYPDLRAREFLDYIAILKGLIDRSARHQRISELLELVSLAKEENRKLKTFSGGMKQRIGIAQALLNDPQLLIVDEPTAGLDPEERVRFRNWLAELGGKRIVLLSTHIVEDIAQTCRRVAVIAKGQIVFDGSTAELAQSAQGQVWIINTEGPKPEGQFALVSISPQSANTTQYRVIGQPTPGLKPQPAVPTVEDGYMCLMSGIGYK